MFRKIGSLIYRDSFFIILIIFLSFTIFEPLLFSDGLPMWLDNSDLPVFNMNKFNIISNFTYSEKFHGMIYNSNLIVTNFLVNKVFLVLNALIKSTEIINFLWVFLPYLVLYISIYVALRILFSNKWLCFLLTLFYIFSPWNLSRIVAGWSTTTYSQAAGFLFISCLLSYLKKPKLRKVFLLSLLTLMGFMNIAHFYVVLFSSFFIFIVYIYINRLKFSDLISSYKSLLFLPFLAFVLNFYWILPNIYMSREAGSSYNFQNIYSDINNTFINTLLLKSEISSLTEHADIFNFFYSPLYLLSYIAFLLFIIYTNFKKYKDNNLALYFIIFVVFFGLSLGERSIIIWDLFKSFPGAFLARSSQLRFFPLLNFGLLLLTGVICSRFKNKILILLLVVNIILGTIGVYKGKVFKYYENVVLPDDYDNLSSYLKKEDRSNSLIVSFPKRTHQTRLVWYGSKRVPYIYDCILNNPLIDLYSSGNKIPTYLEKVYSTQSTAELKEILSSGGVRYVLVNKDYDGLAIPYNFNSTEGFDLVMSGRYLDLYELPNDGFKDIFFVTDKDLSFSKINPTMYKVIANPGVQITLNRQYDVSLKLYDEKDVRDVVYDRCNFSIGDLNFCDVLMLKAKPLPKQPLDETYKNNWILPEDSSGSYVVYYEPQIYFYIGLIISFVAFIFHVLYLLLMRDSDKNKRMVLN